MARLLILLLSGVITLLSCKESIDKRPNIIYILADDLGYGELGVYGQEIIETPHIDALANEGMKFTQHYSGAPVCAPARCILLTGKHAGHAYVRGNDEWGERGKVWDYQAMYDNPFLEGQRPLPDSIVTIAEILQSAGYRTGAVGKWGLGAPTTEGVPNKQGFDFFYGYNCQRQAHTYYPMHLWKNEERDQLDNKYVKLHANFPEGSDPNDPNSYADFNLNDYAPTKMHEQAISFIKENHESPFFFYYASPIPHLPLQAPKEWVDYYREKLGPEDPFTGNSYFPCQYPKATYAAMISYLDEQVGDLVKTLKELGIYENTLIIFTSDNGPTYTGGTDTPYFNSARPFRTEYGRGKGFTHEGGIRVPMIATWPQKIAANSTTDHISAFYDVMATLCDVAGEGVPEDTDGLSFYPTLVDSSQISHEYLFWEFPEYGGQQAVRIGKWKGIRKNIRKGNLDVELYDLENDIREETNVANENPDIVKKVKNIMKEARTVPDVDRFKLEALGDVMQSYRDAVQRIESRSNDFRKVEIRDGYFNLSGNTKVYAADGCERGLNILQSRLKHTGGYEMQPATDEESNILVFDLDGSIGKGQYVIEVTHEKILITASERLGYYNAINSLITLLDDKINHDLEMHNPVWTIAGATINS